MVTTGLIKWDTPSAAVYPVFTPSAATTSRYTCAMKCIPIEVGLIPGSLCIIT